jgi:hypothetical protein
VAVVVLEQVAKCIGGVAGVSGSGPRSGGYDRQGSGSIGGQRKGEEIF